MIECAGMSSAGGIMHKTEREEQIVEVLKSSGFVSVKDLSDILYISESSVRRDLTELENKGIVKRSYGGAKLITANTNVLPFYTRAFSSVSEKKIIAQKASELIKDESIIFLDQSSTAYFLAQEICDKSGLTVITNNIEILVLLSQYDMRVHSSGGILSKDNRNCLIGRNAQKTFENIYADFCFFSAKSLSEDGIISDYTQEEVFVRNSMLANAQCKVFLCNGEKFGSHSNYKQCSLADIDYLISEDDSAHRFEALNKNLKIK